MQDSAVWPKDSRVKRSYWARNFADLQDQDEFAKTCAHVYICTMLVVLGSFGPELVVGRKLFKEFVCGSTPKVGKGRVARTSSCCVPSAG